MVLGYRLGCSTLGHKGYWTCQRGYISSLAWECCGVSPARGSLWGDAVLGISGYAAGPLYRWWTDDGSSKGSGCICGFWENLTAMFPCGTLVVGGEDGAKQVARQWIKRSDSCKESTENRAWTKKNKTTTNKQKREEMKPYAEKKTNKLKM